MCTSSPRDSTKGVPAGTSIDLSCNRTLLTQWLLRDTAQWSTGLRRMLAFDRSTNVGGEHTRLTVRPSTLQFQLVAGKPFCAGHGDWTSKTGLYQRHHA